MARYFGHLMSIRGELDRLGFQAVTVEINEIVTTEELTPPQYSKLLHILQQAGIELFEDKKDILVQNIKNIITNIVYHIEEPLIQNLSAYLVEKLHHDYTYMSNLFSETQQITIEKFYISHKIERVKELLLYEKMSLTEIAYKMHYSSLAYLSNQFKRVTGLTTSQFKHQYRKDDLLPEAAGRLRRAPAP
jgi:YesN/AraC family two-component response regulator